MSFTRVHYDSCAYDEILKQTQEPGRYKLYSGQVGNCQPCAAPNGPRNNRLYNSSETQTVKRDDNVEYTPLVEVESLLSNRSYPNSRCMAPNTLKEKDAKLSAFAKGPKPDICNIELQSEDTRLTHPLDNYRGIRPDRFEWPIIDPVEFIYWLKDDSSRRDGTNTRLDVKDSFKKLYPAAELRSLDGTVAAPKLNAPCVFNCSLGK
ncbi:MAG: hypothetical protein Faunusvirus12_4 [Faunusvirus sp.]|jgi:hypothetical protein|uniref:Uncharacterized protein n=1 Tax=Faunusvirus sp. TaxID=2487766 RepID=A0A3G4ZZG1_9VIRU|nr:MAG: hypothetical protein Faunusvirus12_4 [Faunusvirus sp.]